MKHNQCLKKSSTNESRKKGLNQNGNLSTEVIVGIFSRAQVQAAVALGQHRAGVARTTAVVVSISFC